MSEKEVYAMVMIMKVKELIKELELLDKEKDVIIYDDRYDRIDVDDIYEEGNVYVLV